MISKYPNTVVAGDASLLLAEAQAKEGKIDESTATLQAFVKAQPEHPLAGAARYGIGENYRQQGKLPEALEAFRSVRTESAGSYAAPLAQLSRHASSCWRRRPRKRSRHLILWLRNFPEPQRARSPVPRPSASGCRALLK